MRAIELQHLPEFLTGHISLVDTPEGKQPLRFPAGEAHLYDMFNQLAATMDDPDAIVFVSRDAGDLP
jgi:hypothetical protein